LESEKRQVDLIAQLLMEMSGEGDFILIVDEGGVYDDSGDYQPYLAKVIERLSPLPRPILGFVQTRMMPYAKQLERKWSTHIRLFQLRNEDVQELVSFSLKREGIDFSRFAIRFIEHYGIPSLLSAPGDLIEWKRRRAEDFIAKITFDQLETDIICILVE